MAQSKSEHTVDSHMKKLNELCRICGRRVKSRRDRRKNSTKDIVLCKSISDDLNSILGIQVCEESDSTVYPKSLCSTCHRRLQKLKCPKTQTPSLLKIALDEVKEPNPYGFRTIQT